MSVSKTDDRGSNPRGPALNLNFMQRKIVLFDFDGVIIDSFSAAFETSKKFYPQLTEGDYRKLFEGNINDWIGKLHDDADFFAEYIPMMENGVRPTRGINETIKKMAEVYTLIVVSSGMTNSIKDFMEREGLAECFAEIMGNDVHRSKVEKIKMIFLKYGAAGQNCVLITDTLGDMREAEQAGVGAIGVSWGFHDRDTLQNGNHFRVVESLEELLAAVSDYFSETNEQ